MLKIKKNIKETTFDEKKVLLRNYYLETVCLCDNYNYDRGSAIINKREKEHLEEFINDLTNVKNRIEELEGEIN